MGYPLQQGEVGYIEIKWNLSAQGESPSRLIATEGYGDKWPKAYSR
jgi:hypothetical protein